MSTSVPVEVAERRVRKDLAGILPPTAVRFRNGIAWVQPAEYQFSVTADRLREAGYSVADEAGDGWLLAQHPDWLDSLMAAPSPDRSQP